MHFFAPVVLIITVLSLQIMTKSNRCTSSLCLPSKYNKMNMPTSDDRLPLKVKVALLPLYIYKIDHIDFTVDIKVHMRVTWSDTRLIINSTKSEAVDVDFVQKLWIPDIYIYDLKEMISSMTSQTITPNGGLTVSQEDGIIKLTYVFEPRMLFVCPLRYANFPFHSYSCYLRIGSFTQKIEEMVFVPDERLDPDYVLKTGKEVIQDYTIKVSHLTGEKTKHKTWIHYEDVYYSIMGLEIRLESKYEKYIYIYYLPTSMFTLTSWVSFLLPATSYPARTTLLVTMFLCQTGVFAAVIKETPNGGEKTTCFPFFMLCYNAK